MDARTSVSEPTSISYSPSSFGAYPGHCYKPVKRFPKLTLELRSLFVPVSNSRFFLLRRTRPKETTCFVAERKLLDREKKCDEAARALRPRFLLLKKQRFPAHEGSQHKNKKTTLENGTTLELLRLSRRGREGPRPT